jgi:hypothetical protein
MLAPAQPYRLNRACRRAIPIEWTFEATEEWLRRLAAKSELDDVDRQLVAQVPEVESKRRRNASDDWAAEFQVPI